MSANQLWLERSPMRQQVITGLLPSMPTDRVKPQQRTKDAAFVQDYQFLGKSAHRPRHACTECY